MPAPRRIVVLGSTGSIGTQALDVAGRNPGRFGVVGPVRRAERTSTCSPSRRSTSPSRWSRCTGPPRLPTCSWRSTPRRSAAASRPGLAMPRMLAGPGREHASVAAWACDVVLNGMAGAAGCARRSPRCAPVAPWRWRTRSRSSSADRWSRRWPARPDRPRRLRALGARPVPARRERRRGPPAGAHRQRRAVPRRTPRRSSPTSPLEQALAHPTWDMGPVVTSTPRR